MRVAATSVLVTLAVLGASCATGGNDAEEPAAASDVEEPSDVEQPSDVEPAVEVDASDAEPAAEIDIAGFSFAPETIEIDVGDTVRWTNGDATRHTVTAGADGEPTGAFHLTFDDRGASAGLEFTQPGEYLYFCTPHPFMQGTISVSG